MGLLTLIVKNSGKYPLLLLAFTAGLFFRALPAQAEGGYYAPAEQRADRPVIDEKQSAREDAEAKGTAPEPEPGAANTFTVTSIEKCYAQLSREDALDIQKNYIKPYQECRRRLVLKLKNEQWSKNKQGTKPESFYRVQQKDDSRAEDADQKKRENPPVSEKKAPLN
jgi:hypothetical protein